MKVELTSTKENFLLKRKEVDFRVEQDPKGKTPTRLEVKNAVAAKMKISEETVFIKKMRTMTGTNTAVGIANIYERLEQAELIEPEYIIKRNTPPKKPEEEE